MGLARLCVLGLFLLRTPSDGYQELEIKPTLRADRGIIPAGGSVTLTCSVEDGSDGWSFEWFRNDVSVYPAAPYGTNSKVISEGGKYTCRGRRRGGAVFYTDYSQELVIKETQLEIKPTLGADREILPAGGSVTLTCSVEGRSDLIYELYRGSSRDQFIEYKESGVFIIKEGGQYTCIGRGRRGGADFYTDYSREVVIKETLLQIKPTLRADREILPAGGSVTLTCSVEGRSDLYYKLFRGSSTYPVTEYERSGNFRIREVGEYTCMGYNSWISSTSLSDPVIIQETVPPKPTVVLQPSWTLIYRGETVTATCQIKGEGGTQWEYEWRRNGLNSPETSREINISDGGGFSCRGRRDEFSITEWSDVITVRVSAGRPAASLRADRRIIPAGGSVTLTCSVEDGSDGWSFDWFKNGVSVYLEAQPKTDNKVLTVSEGGRYTCRGGRGGEAVFYTENSREVVIKETHLSVPDRAESFSFPVLMVVGAVVVVGVFLLVLPLLLCRCRRSEASPAEQTENQDGNQQQLYSSLLHGDLCVYETVSGCQTSAADQQEAVYANT
ncbi:B-cell receptor CD22-like [Menidia menidia]